MTYKKIAVRTYQGIKLPCLPIGRQVFFDSLHVFNGIRFDSYSDASIITTSVSFSRVVVFLIGNLYQSNRAENNSSVFLHSRPDNRLHLVLNYFLPLLKMIENNRLKIIGDIKQSDMLASCNLALSGLDSRYILSATELLKKYGIIYLVIRHFRQVVVYSMNEEAKAI